MLLKTAIAQTERKAMTSLESIVLPLAESKALVEKGIVLETALVWQTVEIGEHNPMPPVVTINFHMESMYPSYPAPTLSELLDAIRAKVDKPTAETTFILSRDGSEAGASCAGIRTEGGKYEIAPASTDLLAAYALLMEVTK